MARPSPLVLLEYLDPDSGTQIEILAASAVYVVMYQGQHIGIRAQSHGLGISIKKYKKLSFNHEGSARRAVKQLNQQFNTEDFSYIKIGAQDEITFK